MPRVRLLWASGKQTIQYVADKAADWIPVDRDRFIHTFRALDDSDEEGLAVYKELPLED